MRFQRILFAAAAVLASLSSPATALEVEWRLVQPFRFFRSEIDYRLHLEAAQKTAGKPSEIEGRINDFVHLRKWYEAHRDDYERQYRATNRHYVNLAREDNLTLLARQGWASTVWEDGTCWSRSSQRHDACLELATASLAPPDVRKSVNPYVLPVGHLVIASVAAPPAGDCRWETDRKLFHVDSAGPNGAPSWTATVTRPCQEKVQLFVPWDRAANKSDATVRVAAIATGDAPTTAPVSVRDVLVVGLGDSFASGEGNPDFPVPLSTMGGYAFAPVPLKDGVDWDDMTVHMPRRLNPKGPAKWLDTKCHRSLYSAQLRSAMQIALADPDQRTAVTFLGYACSGAEVSEGLLFAYAGKEDVSAGGLQNGLADAEAPQIDKAVRELCETTPKTVPLFLGGDRVRAPYNEKKAGYDGRWRASIPLLRCDKLLRRPDLVMLSAGGNDIGFAPLIAHVTVSKDASALGFKVRKQLAKNCADPARRGANCQLHGVDVAEARLKELPARYKALRSAIRERLQPLAGDAAVAVAAYPHAYHDAAGKLCPDGDDGMTVVDWFDVNSAELKKVCKFAGRLYSTMQTGATDFGWTFINAHRPAFIGHGFCARKSGAGLAEETGLPFRCEDPNKAGTTCNAYFNERNQQGSTEWQLMHPAYDLRAYASRQRWFRTYNDSFLMVNYWRKGAPPSYDGGPGTFPVGDSIDVAQLSLGGPIHPTAQALAHVADRLAAASADVLGLDFQKLKAANWRMDDAAVRIDAGACD